MLCLDKPKYNNGTLCVGGSKGTNVIYIKILFWNAITCQDITNICWNTHVLFEAPEECKLECVKYRLESSHLSSLT